MKHSWYTRSVQYLISQQRLHDGTDAQTLYVSQESETHFHGSYRTQTLRLCASFVSTSLGSSPIAPKRTVADKKRCANILSVHSESVLKTVDGAHRLFTSRGTEKLMCGIALVMHQGWPLPPCHISSENLTWHVYIGFLHLPFKPLWAS